MDEDEDDTPEFTTTTEGSGSSSASATDVVSTSAEESEEEVAEVKLRPAAGVETTALFPAFFGKGKFLWVSEVKKIEILASTKHLI